MSNKLPEILPPGTILKIPSDGDSIPPESYEIFELAVPIDISKDKSHTTERLLSQLKRACSMLHGIEDFGMKGHEGYAGCMFCGGEFADGTNHLGNSVWWVVHKAGCKLGDFLESTRNEHGEFLAPLEKAEWDRIQELESDLHIANVRLEKAGLEPVTPETKSKELEHLKKLLGLGNPNQGVPDVKSGS